MSRSQLGSVCPASAVQRAVPPVAPQAELEARSPEIRAARPVGLRAVTQEFPALASDPARAQRRHRRSSARVTQGLL